MKKKIFSYVSIFLVALMAVYMSACTNIGSPNKDLQAKVDSLQTELKKFTDEKARTERLLTRFDSLDYNFYNDQQWDSFAQSHASNIKVYYPDGSVSTGLFPQHIDMLKPMFVFAPDTKIRTHPVKFGNGDWTCVIGVMDGTFSKPMPIGNGQSIPPTGKKFKLSMATIGHWGPDGKMSEEYLFWDNQAFMKQIGLGK